MSLLLIDNYVKRVGIVYLNVLEMLEARGIDREIVKRNMVDMKSMLVMVKWDKQLESMV